MATYAANTSVTADASLAEIKKILGRYGADAFGYSEDGRRVAVAFRLEGRHFRLTLTLPDPFDRDFTHHAQGERSATARANRWEQACRQRWRALALVIKAKLEAVEAGISTIEEEFLAAMVLPDRQTVAEWMAPQIEEAYRLGHMPQPLMIEGPSK